MSRVIADGLSKRAREEEIGQFGLGKHSGEVTDTENEVTDLNAVKNVGFYAVNHQASNSPVSFITGLKASLIVTAEGGVGDRVNQLLLQGSSNKKAWFRTQDSDASWQPWQEIFHTGNILGTVSQSAGVPTGAIIEAGSNANGNYTKFADGTMWASISINLGNRAAFGSGTLSDPYRTGAANWTFPAAFSSAPEIFASGSINNASAGVRANSTSFASVTATSVNTVQIICTASPSTASDATIHVSAFGRWF